MVCGGIRFVGGIFGEEETIVFRCVNTDSDPSEVPYFSLGFYFEDFLDSIYRHILLFLYGLVFFHYFFQGK